MAKEIVAFANASGGRIFIVIADNVTVPETIITNKLRCEVETIARSCDPPVSILSVEFEDTVVIINIPEGTNNPIDVHQVFTCTSVGAASDGYLTDSGFFRIGRTGTFDELVCLLEIQRRPTGSTSFFTIFEISG